MRKVVFAIVLVGCGGSDGGVDHHPDPGYLNDLAARSTTAQLAALVSAMSSGDAAAGYAAVQILLTDVVLIVGPSPALSVGQANPLGLGNTVCADAGCTFDAHYMPAAVDALVNITGTIDRSGDSLVFDVTMDETGHASTVPTTKLTGTVSVTSDVLDGALHENSTAVDATSGAVVATDLDVDVQLEQLQINGLGCAISGTLHAEHVDDSPENPFDVETTVTFDATNCSV